MSSPLGQTLWNARIPLCITHASPSSPRLVMVTSVPRFGYLALLLPRLAAFFGAPCSSFHFEGVQLRNLAAGLLLDLYHPALPWRLTVGDGVAWDIGDTFLNGVKEMSKEHTTQLWNAVVDNDYAAYAQVHARLLDAPTALKHVPVRVYIPSRPPPGDPDSHLGSFKVVQSLVPAASPDGKPTLLGRALHHLMPRLFPSSRDSVLAGVVLHGAPPPFDAPLRELMRDAAYPDGWLCFVVVV